MFLKRFFDLAFTVPLLILFSPIFLLISLLIWVSSGTPIFFRQVRVGYEGKLFKIIKFRTMLTDAAGQNGRFVTASSDKRITRIGKLLRKYKLDELPQLLNVLLGEMSLVGPRPEVPKYVELYPDSVRKEVLSVFPGITDLASIEFHNEEDILVSANNVEERYLRDLMPLKLRLAQRYVKDRSQWLDIKILIRTFFMLLRKG